MRKRVLLAWSSGKDSAWSLVKLLNDSSVEVIGLVSTLNQSTEQVPIHFAPKNALCCQAQMLGLPIYFIDLPENPTNEQYCLQWSIFLNEHESLEVSHIAFGDLFLEDIRQFREQQFSHLSVSLLFPLWMRNTRELAHEMIEGGLGAFVVSSDKTQVEENIVGMKYDLKLLERLAPSVDPCGENGEFHTFVYTLPNVKHPLTINIKESLQTERFFYSTFDCA